MVSSDTDQGEKTPASISSSKTLRSQNLWQDKPFTVMSLTGTMGSIDDLKVNI